MSENFTSAPAEVRRAPAGVRQRKCRSPRRRAIVNALLIAVVTNGAPRRSSRRNRNRAFTHLRECAVSQEILDSDALRTHGAVAAVRGFGCVAACSRPLYGPLLTFHPRPWSLAAKALPQHSSRRARRQVRCRARVGVSALHAVRAQEATGRSAGLHWAHAKPAGDRAAGGRTQ